MIAHVAEAGEERGRVVLRLSFAEPHAIALEAAVRVARAFNSQLEGLFVEDEQLLSLAAFPFAREISRAGRARPLSADALSQELRLAFAGVKRRISELAREANVPLTQRIVRAEPVAAVAEACAACGPWNVVAVGDPILGSAPDEIGLLLSAVADTTGLIVVGPRARRTTGPVLIALEDSAWLPGLVRAASRLAALAGERVVLLPVGPHADERAWLEAEARLTLADSSAVEIATAEEGAEPFAAIQRLAPGFVLALHGRAFAPAGGPLARLAAALECPLFLVK